MPPRPIDSDYLVAHLTPLRTLARILVADPDRAEDLLQETALRALESPPARPGNLRAWLGRILRNLASNQRRGESRRRRRETRAPAAAIAPAAAEVSARREVLARLVEAVGRLGDPLGTTLQLRFFEEVPVKEIARRQRVPVATVHTRLRRGIARLREEMDLLHGRDRQAWLGALLPFARTGAPAGAGGLAAGWLLAAAVLVVAGAVGVWAWRVRGEGEDVPGVGPVAREIKGLAEEIGVPETGPVRARGSTDTSPVEKAVARFLLPDGKTPAAGARVHVVGPLRHGSPELDRLDRRARRYDPFDTGEFTDLEAACVESGVCHTLDAGGVLTLPGGRRQYRLSARLGSLWAQGVFPRQDLRETLFHLRPDRDLRVRVVDEQGHPRAGVPVAVCTTRPTLHSYNPRWESLTDTAGLAVIPHVTTLFARTSTPDVVVTLPCLLASPVEKSFVKGNLPEEPVALILPPTGRVEIEVMGAGGRPGKEPVCVALMAVEKADPDVVTPFRASLAERMARLRRGVRLVRGRQASFPIVGLGREWWAGAWRHDPLDREPQVARRRFRGPTTPGGTVRLTLILPDPSKSISTFSGRLVDEKKRPLAGIPLEASLQGRGTPLRVMDGLEVRSGRLFHTLGRRQRCRTDGAGRFRFSFPRACFREKEYRLCIAVGKRFAGPLSHSWLRKQLPIGPKGASVDLGEVRFQGRHPLLAAGQVVDHRGRPVAGARIGVTKEVFRPYPDAPQRFAWEGMEFLPPTGEQGRFALRTGEKMRALELHAVKDGWATGPTKRVAPGTTGIRLELLPAGWIEGMVAFPAHPALNEQTIRGRLFFALIAQGDGAEFRCSCTDTLLGGGRTPPGRYRLRSGKKIPPGRYRLEVYRADGPRERCGDPLFTLPGLKIEANRPCVDPRLRSLDLRPYLSCFLMTVETPRGRPAEWVTCYEGSKARIKSCFHGTRFFVAPAGGTDLLLLPNDPNDDSYRVEQLKGVDRDLRMVLRPKLELRISLDSLGRTLEPGERMRVTLTPDPRPFWLSAGSPGSSASFTRAGKAALRVPFPGTWRVALSVRAEGRPRRRTTGFTPARIRVEPAPRVQEFALRFPAR